MSSIEDNDVEQIDETNFRRLHEKAAKVGYADGVGAGKESSFQFGFDKGYIDGLRTGFELEKFHSFFSTISKAENVDGRLLKEADNYTTMDIAETTKQDHFQYIKHQDASLDEISKFQHEYVDNCLADLKENLPTTNNLFS